VGNHKKRCILAVFAHPDDETSVGPLLAKYAGEGHEVYLVSFTSGQKGAAHTNIPPGEQLGSVREGELRCAAERLGIHQPLLFRFQDQGICDPVVMEKAAERLRAVINQTKPDVLITFGPGGLTGHLDHIAASEITTHVFQQQGLLQHRPKKLYYVAFPESRLQNVSDSLESRRPLHLVSDCFITTEIDCRAFLEKAYAAIQCHKTQFPPQRMAWLKEMFSKILEGRAFLRLALSTAPFPRERETSLFEGFECETVLAQPRHSLQQPSSEPRG
jgi:LmbE family N-acetylglucosaminyl deacetylase